MKYDFPSRLKKLRLKKSMTMTQLAAETNLSYTSIQSWESGGRVPAATAVIILADFFGVTADYLLGRAEN